MDEVTQIRDATQPDSSPGGLFARNRVWAESKIRLDPTFFSRLVGQRRPLYFWIGCSDSRVPATEIVDLDPGEMFVHHNVANLAVSDDFSFAAALQFVVEVLEVRHIMIVGHHGCGGIQAAMDSETDDPIGRWLAPIRRLYRDAWTGKPASTPMHQRFAKPMSPHRSRPSRSIQSSGTHGSMVAISRFTAGSMQ